MLRQYGFADVSVLTFAARAVAKVVVGVAFVLPLSAAARDWPTTAGWDVVEGDDYCAIYLQYEGKGESELMLGLRTDGGAWVGLSNSNWTIKAGEKVDLTYSINGSEYSGAAAIGVEPSGSYKKGFVAKFGSDFLVDFAASSYLIIHRGEVLVDNLSLKGSAAALAVARRCLTAVKRDIAAAAAEKRRYSSIADDPFAKPNPQTPNADSVPKAIGDTLLWFPADSYPIAAKRAGASGTVGWQAEVDADGRVTACVITRSSGNADLDDVTCRLLQRNGRFQRGFPGKAASQVHWSLTDE